MAAISSAASGPWSSASTWAGGVVPTAADSVTVLNGHTVTLNATGLACLSLSVSGGATVNASASASSTLTCQNVITVQNGGTWDTDVSSNAAIVCTIVLNGAGANAPIAFRGNNQTAKISMKGASRKRVTTLTAAVSAGATSASVVDATGWRTGDTVCFATTTPGSPLATETKVVTVSGTNITWTGGLTYTYKSGGHVGNMSSNMIVTSAVNTEAANGGIYIECQQEPVTKPKYFSNVQFLNLGTQGYAGGLNFSNSYWQSDSVTGVVDCAFFGSWGTALGVESSLATFPLERCVFWSSNDHSVSSWNQHLRLYGSQKASQVKDCLFSRNLYGVAVTGNLGYWEFDGNVFSGGRFTGQNPYTRVTNSEFSILSGGHQGISYLENCSIGVSFGEVRLTDIFNVQEMADMTLKDCYIPAAAPLAPYWVTSLSNVGAPDAARLTIINRDKDPTKQDIYTNFSNTVPTYTRENFVTYRSSSSFKFKVQKLNYSRPYKITVPCASGASVRLIGYVRRTLTSITATVTVSGLGITPAVYTNAAAANTWDKWDITVTNSSGGDGQFTVSYDATDAASTAGSVYFDGVPDSPFVTKCRHYGFTFDEANPGRTVNTLTVASEATAIAYTGVTINSATPQITVGAGTANTFRKVYDHIQAWAVQNIDKPVLLTSTDGNNFAVPLTCKVVWPGMGTDGTLAGGWLQLAAPGTHTYKLSGTKIEFQAAGAYNMSGAQFGGTVELVNTSGGAVTVSVPSGTSYTNTGPGITVTAPTTNQSVTVNGMEPGSRIQIYDLSSSTELFNGVVAGSSHTWSDPSAPVAPRTIRLRAAWVSGTVAKQFVDTGIGTCGTGVGDAAVTYLINQQADAIYGANAVDGSTVTGITIVDAVDRMQINIAGGTVSWKAIYAYNVYWLATEDGIKDDGSIIAAKDVANYTLSLFKIKNTSATPLQITGGYGVDSVTGSVADILDVTGGSIFPVVDHVVSSVVTVSGGNIITGDIADIPAAVLAAAVTTPIHANIQKVNDVIVNGTGATGDEWGP